MKEQLKERVWIFAATICLVCAALFLLRDNMSAAFVAATLGVVAWFLNVRNQLKRTLIPTEEPDTGDEPEDEIEDESDEREDAERD